jgi:hypothetical protein
LNNRTLKTRLYAVAVFAAAFCLYLFTAARDIVVGDSPELITAAATLGVAHPPGYPLFTMLGHLFSLLPIGAIPFRVNLLSVACDALTAMIIFLTALRFSKSHLAAALAALLLAVTPLFWSWSLVAEVFPLNNLLASVIIYLLVRWHENPKRVSWLIAAAFVAGLGLTNHQTIVLLGPAVCFLLWQQRAFLNTRVVAICVIAFLIGLVPYLYILWAASRHPALNWGDVASLRDLFGLIARQNYGTLHLINRQGYTGGSIPDRIIVLINSFNPVAVLLIAIGLVHAYRNLRWYFWFSLLAFGFTGPFFAVVTNLNLATAPSAAYVLGRFFLLPHVVIAPITAFGIVGIAEIAKLYRPALETLALRFAAFVTFIAILTSVSSRYRTIDQSHNHVARHFAEDVLRTAAPNGILLATGDAVILPLIYLRIVEGVRPDVRLIMLPLLPTSWYLKQVRERHPDLIIPLDHFDDPQQLKQLIEANPGSEISEVAVVNEVEGIMDKSYWARPHGLLNVIEPRPFRIYMSEVVQDTERLFGNYRIPTIAEIKPETFESELLAIYALPAWRVGNYYETFGKKDDALNWYHHALTIDPRMTPQVQEALARVER